MLLDLIPMLNVTYPDNHTDINRIHSEYNYFQHSMEATRVKSVLLMLKSRCVFRSRE
jgi:hypothetical protein